MEAQSQEPLSKKANKVIRIIGEGLVVGVLTIAIVFALLWFGN